MTYVPTQECRAPQRTHLCQTRPGGFRREGTLKRYVQTLFHIESTPKNETALETPLQRGVLSWHPLLGWLLRELKGN